MLRTLRTPRVRSSRPKLETPRPRTPRPRTTQDPEHIRVDTQKVFSRKEDQVTNIIISRYLTCRVNIN